MIAQSLELSRLIGDDYGTALALIATGKGTRAEGDEAAAEAYYLDASNSSTNWVTHIGLATCCKTLPILDCIAVTGGMLQRSRARLWPSGRDMTIRW